MAQEYLTVNPAATIDETVSALNPDKVLVVTDLNVEKAFLQKLSDSHTVSNSPVIAVTPGEDAKNIETVTDIWNRLEEIGATRKSLVLNIGGGMVTDIGGFAAATFKRGIRTVNFPTTLLGAVDAATGGKTGVNFNGLKNEIGAFHLPSQVIISTLPFESLDREQLLSGYAEMIKTALFSDREFYLSLFEIDEVLADPSKLGPAVEKCVKIKDEIVAIDPTEKGLRKVLNFGHTAGHAFESIGFETGRKVSHGKAVAHGMLVALILSNMKFGFDSTEMHHYRNLLKEYYGSGLIECKQIPQALEKMSHDKKNPALGKTSFTLLKEIGKPEINCFPSIEEISEALEIYIDFMG